METTEVLISFNNTLIAEGVSDEARITRSATLLHCIEHAEETMAKYKAAQAKKSPPSTMRTSHAYEMALMMLIVGWMLGVLSLDYMRTAR